MISREDVFKEVKSPKKIAEEEEPKFLLYIYKAIYMVLRILLDVRWNQEKLANLNGKTLRDEQKVKKAKSKADNPVISDDVELK